MRFERMAYRLGGDRSIHLSYGSTAREHETMFMLLSTFSNTLPDFFRQQIVIPTQNKLTSTSRPRPSSRLRQLTRAKHTLLFALIRLVKEAAGWRRSSANPHVAGVCARGHWTLTGPIGANSPCSPWATQPGQTPGPFTPRWPACPAHGPQGSRSSPWRNASSSP